MILENTLFIFSLFCFQFLQFALSLMVKTLLSIEPEDPRARKILADFLTYMKGFVSLPLYIPGTPYAMAVKVHTQSIGI